MLKVEDLIETIKKGTPKGLLDDQVRNFRLDAFQYWWARHELARHHEDLRNIAGEMARAKHMAVAGEDGPYYARLLGCLANEAERHRSAQAVYHRQISNITNTWSFAAIAPLFEKLRESSGQWLLIPDPYGNPPREGRDLELHL
jgi:hypothetical protein